MGTPESEDPQPDQADARQLIPNRCDAQRWRAVIWTRRCPTGGPVGQTEHKERAMRSFTRLPAAGVMFFFSAWLLMLFAGSVATYVGIRPFGYATSMVCTVAIWLTIAPAAAAVAGRRSALGRWGRWARAR